MTQTPTSAHCRTGQRQGLYWLAVLTALVALATAVLNFIVMLDKFRRLQEELDQLAGCSGVVLEIKAPQDRLELHADVVFVSGDSTSHEICNNVFIIARDIRKPVWYVVDKVPVHLNGRWSGLLEFAKFPELGTDIEISARVSAQASDYGKGQILSNPPTRGRGSNNALHITHKR
jgi:hypothetical protein